MVQEPLYDNPEIIDVSTLENIVASIMCRSVEAPQT